MIQMSEIAQKGLSKALADSDGYTSLRLVIYGDHPAVYSPQFIGAREEDQTPDDLVVVQGDLKMLLDSQTISKAKGLYIDVVSTPMGPRLTFDFPSPQWDDPLAEKLQKLIDQRINPALMNHGGYVGLLGVRDGVAEIIMGGGCQGCQQSAITLSQSIEAIIMQEIPEIHSVRDRTNHTQGANPYYQQEETQARSKSARRRENRR